MAFALYYLSTRRSAVGTPRQHRLNRHICAKKKPSLHITNSYATAPVRNSSAIFTFATTIGAALTLAFWKVEPSHAFPLQSANAVHQPQVLLPTNSIVVNNKSRIHIITSANASSVREQPQTQAHESLPSKIAAFLRERGVRDELVVLFASALPVVELRGGIPLGFILGLHPIQIFLLSLIGNMLPVIPVALLLKSPFVQRIASGMLERARRKAETVGNSSSRAKALALFVGVPLPGTGAWTGCLVAFVLGMNLRVTFLSLLAGVFISAIIVTTLCLMGTIGALIAAVSLIGGGLVSLFSSVKRRDDANSVGSIDRSRSTREEV